MQQIFLILTGLRAAIAASAARDRALTALLVLVWGRVARIGTRLERLMQHWRAGTLPAPRAARGPRATATARRKSPFPNRPAWLAVMVPGAVAFGSQLAHQLNDPEFAAFVAAVPQARRILRPLFQMLGAIPVPEAVRKAPPVVHAAPEAEGRLVWAVPAPADFNFSGV